jgi:ribosome-binding protein aMBF1 (putative translation factor)
MNCEKCGCEIPEDEEMDFKGRTVCEDCYMDILSPTRACDPWAVHSAKNMGELPGDGPPQMTDTQKKILRTLREAGGLTLSDLSTRIELPERDTERELATLRHMEKIGGEIRDDKKRYLFAM